MATITRFEDIEAWRKALGLTRMLYEVSKRGAFAKDYGLKDQIRRAGVTSMCNIAEGFGRDGDREFVQFLAQARGSTAQTKAQPHDALDARFINERPFQGLHGGAEETGRLIGGASATCRPLSCAVASANRTRERRPSRNPEPGTRTPELALA
jgi:four helix bundle protein